MQVYKKYFKLILLMGLLAFAPIHLLTTMFGNKYLAGFYELLFNDQGGLDVQAASTSAMLTAFGFMCGLRVVFVPLISATAAFLARRHIDLNKLDSAANILNYLKRTTADNKAGIKPNPDLEASKLLPDATMMKWLKLSFTFLVYYFIVFAGLMFILPGLFFSVSLYYCVFIAATGDKWGIEALKESYNQVKGRWFSNFFAIVSVLMFSLFVQTVLSYLLLPLAQNTDIGLVIVNIFISLICVYFDIVLALRYFINL